MVVEPAAVILFAHPDPCVAQPHLVISHPRQSGRARSRSGRPVELRDHTHQLAADLDFWHALGVCADVSAHASDQVDRHHYRFAHGTAAVGGGDRTIAGIWADGAAGVGVECAACADSLHPNGSRPSADVCGIAVLHQGRRDRTGQCRHRDETGRRPGWRQPRAGVSLCDPTTGLAGFAEWCSHELGARTGRIRCDHFVCRQLARPDPDHAVGNLCRV